MRYRRGWNGMTEIVWDEVMPEVMPETKCMKQIRMENIRPRRRYEPAREERTDFLRLAAESMLVMAVMIMIAMLDAADITQTVGLIITMCACMGAVLLLSEEDEKRR